MLMKLCIHGNLETFVLRHVCHVKALTNLYPAYFTSVVEEFLSAGALRRRLGSSQNIPEGDELVTKSGT